MNQGKINVRYAKALFLTGKEREIIPELYRDLVALQKVIKESQEFVQLISNTAIKTSEKKSILIETFQPEVHELTLQFLLLITDNKRENSIPGICRVFIDMVQAYQGIVPATVTTATRLSRSSVENIRKALEKESGKTIEITEGVKPEIIGGLILRIEDRQYDGSISTQLEKIRTALRAT